MKTLKNTIILLLVLIIGINTNTFAGNRDKTENRKVQNFDAIKVSTGIDLYLTMGNSEEVKIVADDDIIDNLITEVKDGTLRIYMKKSNWFNWGNFNQTRKAYVTVKELEKIDASSGSDVKTENTLKGESLEIKASSGSDIDMDIVYKNVRLSASSGSDAKLSGKAKNFEAEASSGSDIVAKNFETQYCKVRASSGSDITVNVTDEIVARASSGADIRYYGNPKMKDTDESSGGDIAGK